MTKPAYGERINDMSMGDLVDVLQKNGPITIVSGGESTRLEYIGTYDYADEEGLAGSGAAEAGPAAGGDPEQ